MSIWTAVKMAEEGQTYDGILSFFFEGTELRKDIREADVFSGSKFLISRNNVVIFWQEYSQR